MKTTTRTKTPKIVKRVRVRATATGSVLRLVTGRDRAYHGVVDMFSDMLRGSKERRAVAAAAAATFVGADGSVCTNYATGNGTDSLHCARAMEIVARRIAEGD